MVADLTIQALHDRAIRRLFAELEDASTAYDKAQLAQAIKNLQTAQNDGLSAAGGSRSALDKLVEAAMSNQPKPTTDNKDGN